MLATQEIVFGIGIRWLGLHGVGHDRAVAARLRHALAGFHGFHGFVVFLCLCATVVRVHIGAEHQFLGFGVDLGAVNKLLLQVITQLVRLRSDPTRSGRRDHVVPLTVEFVWS